MWPWLAVTGADPEVILLSWVCRGFVRHLGTVSHRLKVLRQLLTVPFLLPISALSGIELLWLLRGHMKTFVYLIVDFELHT